jgi:hypothetical protein
VSVSRRGLALLACLCSLAVPASADAARANKAHGNTHHSKKAKKVRAPRKDWDRDGLNNRYERRSHTRPRLADSDSDGIRDGAEDRDRDQVDNRTEQLARTRPSKADSDRDGVPDGAEDLEGDGLNNRGESLMGMHPRKADSDGDGVNDGDEHAGVILRIDGDLMTIALAAGGELVARVNDESDVYCAGDDSAGDDEDADFGPEGDTSDDEDDEDFSDEDPDFPEDEDDEDADEPDLRAAIVARRAAPPCLVPGAIVYEADLETVDGALVFSVIDLLGG